MKKLYYLRHSLKDANNNISPEGIELAKDQGRAFFNASITLNRWFFGPLIRTHQTGEAFLVGYTTAPIKGQQIGPIGDDEFFKPIVTDEFKAAVKSGKSNFEAVLDVHNGRDVDLWKEMAFAGVKLMFDVMEDGEVAVAFGHSPMIELAAYAIQSWKAVDPEYQLKYRRLREMEGINFGWRHPNLSDTVNGIGLWDRVSMP